MSAVVTAPAMLFPRRKYVRFALLAAATAAAIAGAVF